MLKKSAAYFTGNPKFFEAIIHLSSRSGTSASTRLPKNHWMSQYELSSLLNIKTRLKEYNLLSRNLSRVASYNNPQDIDFLSRFVKPGKTLIPNNIDTSRDIDEFGRSYGYGSRKTARAQAWIIKGDGQFFINGICISNYFTCIEQRQVAVEALDKVDSFGKYNVWCLVENGGKKGQSEAIRTAVARALTVQDPKRGETLNKVGLTKIDRRQNERKKTGQPSARKKNRWVRR